MSEEKPNPFNIIRHRGEPQKAEFEGIPIKREEKLFIREWGMFVNCAPYDDHFVFQVPKSRLRKGVSEYMCTCGAAAVVANPEIAKERLFVCLLHATYGHHSTSIINKDDFERGNLDKTIDIEGKKWLI